MPRRDRLPHILLGDNGRSEAFTSPVGGGSSGQRPSTKGRGKRADRLLRHLASLTRHEAALVESREELGLDDVEGIVVEVVTTPDAPLESLEDTRGGTAVLSVRHTPDKTYVALFVPHGDLAKLQRKIEAYRDEDHPKSGLPKNNDLVGRLRAVRRAAVPSFWTDDPDLFPSDGQAIWWEVWLRAGKDREALLGQFTYMCDQVGIRHKTAAALRLLDRTVVLAYATPEQMAESVDILDCIAELRLAKEAADFFVDLPARDQRDWTDDLEQRIGAESKDLALCLLDSGVVEHPLVHPFLVTTVTAVPDQRGGLADRAPPEGRPHGTLMAGLGVYGEELPRLLATNDPWVVPYVLESAKVVDVAHKAEPDNWGFITQDAVSRVLIEAPPERQRVLCMTVTSRDSRDHGMPTAWSAAVDDLVVAKDQEPEDRQILFVSAGNAADWRDLPYPDASHTDAVHDPAQAWNVVTVGAYTSMSVLDAAAYPDWEVLAGPGTLSPTSTTSLTWPDEQVLAWASKPDIVMEGGNAAVDPSGHVDVVDSLQLLTTHGRPMDRLLTTTGDTSASATLAARVATLVRAEHPDLWPETIRALVVHSARWTPGMMEEVKALARAERVPYLLRCYGHGVPDLAAALHSASDAVTLVAQDSLTPFRRADGRADVVTHQMNLHPLPWPTDLLRSLGETTIELSVTLSYYVEPNPGRRGVTSRYVYPSHQLRFDLPRPGETLDGFRQRVNERARGADVEPAVRIDRQQPWLIGSQARRRGSLHRDVWRGPAADLADAGHVIVYPATGWWKTRKALGRYDSEARYALVVSLKAPEVATGVEIDLYTPIAIAAGVAVPVSVAT